MLARDAACETGDQPAVGEAVDHRQLLGQPQRVVQGQQVAVDQQLEPLRALRGGGGEEVGRVHQAVGRGVVLVEADAVKAEPIHLLPGGEMLRVRAHRDLGIEVALFQRPGQLACAILEVIQMLPVGQEIKDKDLHNMAPKANVRYAAW